MATTPEGRTKVRIKRALNAHGCWSFMPVQTGYGAKDLDFICGRKRYVFGKIMWELFHIEAKAHGENPSAFQWIKINEYREAGRKVFVIDDESDKLTPKYDSIKDLKEWLDSH